jgi:hypothetical protein
MRDHLIDLRLAAVAPRVAPVVPRLPGSTPNVDASRVDLREQHREALVASLGHDFAERCAQSMSSAQIDCVTSAPDQDSANACSGR